MAEGKFTDKISISDPPFEWGNEKFSGLNDTARDLVEQKFNASLDTANTMLEKLLGADGNSGYLGKLYSLIQEYNVPSINNFSVDIPAIGFTPDNRPAPDMGLIDNDFPTFSASAPVYKSLPDLDFSQQSNATIPEDIALALEWAEDPINSPIIAQLVTRILNDLQYGATGLDPIVEQEIYDRARARQNLENDKAQTEIEEYFSSRGFELPPLAMAGRLQQHTMERTMKLTDINGQIMEKQADLAQKNSQFIIQISKDLHAVLEDVSDKKNNRQLDYKKTVATLAVNIFSESVKKFIAIKESDIKAIEVQVENLKAVVAYNKGLSEQYSSEADVYGKLIDGKAKRNTAITDLFKAEVEGYAAETKALSDSKMIDVEQYKLLISNADLQLRRETAQVDASLKGYAEESTLRADIAKAMANIAMQAVASAQGSVHASAGIDYNMGRSQSESWSHGESRQLDYNLSNSLSEQHPFEEESIG